MMVDPELRLNRRDLRENSHAYASLAAIGGRVVEFALSRHPGIPAGLDLMS